MLLYFGGADSALVIDSISDNSLKGSADNLNGGFSQLWLCASSSSYVRPISGGIEIQETPIILDGEDSNIKFVGKATIKLAD